jgi:hypothetical protein
VEAVEAPEHHSFPRCHHEPFAVRIGVDAQRHFDALRHESPKRESDRPRESASAVTLTRHRYAPQILDVAEGLNYLHASYTIHGDLKGVGVFFGPSKCGF